MDELLNEHKQAIKKIKFIWNKSVAHNERNLDERSVFKQAGITPDEMEHLIEEVCGILNKMASKEPFPKRIPEDRRFESAMHALLDELGNH